MSTPFLMFDDPLLGSLAQATKVFAAPQAAKTDPLLGSFENPIKIDLGIFRFATAGELKTSPFQATTAFNVQVPPLLDIQLEFTIPARQTPPSSGGVDLDLGLFRLRGIGETSTSPLEVFGAIVFDIPQLLGIQVAVGAPTERRIGRIHRSFFG